LRILDQALTDQAQANPEGPTRSGRRPPLTGVAITLAGIGLLAILVFAIDPLRDAVSDVLSGRTGALRYDLRELGLGGVLMVLLLALIHVVVWYPTEILNLAAGFVYGFWAALALMTFAWVVNGIVAYFVGMYAARPLLYRLIGQARFERIERIAANAGAPTLLAMRLIPVVPFSFFSVVAGAARVHFPTYAWTTAVGYIPLTAVFVYLGSQLEELSPTDPILWLGALVVIALVLLTHRLGSILGDKPRPPAPKTEAEGRA